MRVGALFEHAPDAAADLYVAIRLVGIHDGERDRRTHL